MLRVSDCQSSELVGSGGRMLRVSDCQSSELVGSGGLVIRALYYR